jgi:hypothetical protein
MAAGIDDEPEEPDDDVGLAEAETFVPAVATEPAEPSGEAERLGDEPDPLTDGFDPDAEEELEQPAGDDNDIPAFRRIRSSPTPPED